MSVRAMLRAVLQGGGEAGCRDCAHFCSAGAQVERALPGVAILSSLDSSVWAQSGLCLHHDRLTNGARRCAGFAARAATVPQRYGEVTSCPFPTEQPLSTLAPRRGGSQP